MLSKTRDSLGRVTDKRTTVGGTLALKETVPAWNNLDKVNGVYSERAGAGAWNEYRGYAYDNSARLIYEEFSPSPSAGGDYLLTAYDGPTWGQNATGGIGVRTHTQRGSDAVLLHEVPSVSTFARVASENVGGSQPRTVPLSGVALGADTVTLTLDGRDITPVNFPGWQDASGNWTANALLAPGFHSLTATATHPSGWAAPPATHSFTVLPRAESVTNTYDEMGNVASRTWSSGRVQTLTWDPRGRLVKVVQTGVEPFVWTALYDGLDRRIQTTYMPQGGAVVTTSSVFDPEVEFLEIGLSIGGAWNWKVYGPDISGAYGGLQGLGGIEAVIGSDGITHGIVSDWFGNAVGHVAAPGGAMTWSPAQFLAWGPAPGWGTPLMDGTKPLHELLGYRGLTVDPPGYVQQGLRPYDPQTGRWLSPDPVGHAGSLSLYDYCDNDPLNVFDPDGRFGKGVSSGWSGSISSSAPNTGSFSTGMSVGAVFSGGVSGFGRGASNIGIGVKDTAVGTAQTAWAFSGGAAYNAWNSQQTIYGALGSSAYILATSSAARSAAWSGVNTYAYETFTDTDKFSQRIGGGGAVTLMTLGVGKAAESLRVAGSLPTLTSTAPKLFHYTDSAGAAGIRAASRTLTPGAASGGKVWATTSTPEQVFGAAGWWHRLKMGGGVNFEFGGPLGIRYTSTTKFTRYFEIEDSTTFSRDWIKGSMGQYYRRGEAAVK